MLESIGSPFMGFETPQFDDFMLALWICSNRVTPGQNTSTVKLPLKWRIVSKFLHRIADKDAPRMWASIIAMQEYIFEALWFKPPIATRHTQLCRTSTCPAFIPMKRTLMSEWGYTEEQVYNLPLIQAKIEHCATLEHEGALTFTTQADKDIIAIAMLPENLAWNKRVREEAARKVAARQKKAA